MPQSLIASVLLLAVPLAAQFPEAEISNGLITAKLYLPDVQRGYYRGTRFDWSGQIFSLRTSKHEYFGKWFEKYDPKLHDAIMGPVEEFTTGNSALGYDEAKTGETFVRIGVGTLRKPEEPRFDRFKTYEVVDHGTWQSRSEHDSVTFVQTLKSPSGYAYRYVKTVRLVPGKSEMVISHTLENTGAKAIQTQQYNHNFFVIDGKPTGPQTYVKFPFELQPTRAFPADLAKTQGGEVVYQRELKSGESVYGEFAGFKNSAEDFDIVLENRDAGAGVRITGDRPIAKLVYWSIRTTFCPEPYIDLAVEPGKKTEWDYKYRFYDVP